MNYINHFNLFGVEARQRPTLVGNGSPTAQTVGSVGELYMDKSNGEIYKCISAEKGSYTWELLTGEMVDELKKYVDEQTEIIQSDLSGLQSQLNEESHFKGYLSTNAKIQALEATPNDFAYSAESGTKWVFDAEIGWKDTGTPVPDQLTPASDSSPLMNGTASAGTANEYARGDHRHPTDTTRVSVETFQAATQTISDEAEYARRTAEQNQTDIAELKRSQGWELIGKTTLSADSENIAVNLPEAVSEWYNETLMLIEIQKSETQNGTTSGNVSLVARKGTSVSCMIFTVSSTSASYGALDPTWVNRWAVLTQWLNKKPLCTTVMRSRASTQGYSASSMSSATFSYSDNINGATNILFRSNNEFVFPKGSTFEIYGRF